MEFPAELREKIEQLLYNETDERELKSACEGISKRYRENSGCGARLLGSRGDVLAYAAVRMPATFGAAEKALRLTLDMLPEDGRTFATALDAGAGTGAASFAAAMLTGCENILCLEREPQMISVGKELSALCAAQMQWRQAELSEGVGDSRAELVICSYCLNELRGGDANIAVGRLWDATERLLIIVEPGTPSGFSRILSVRERLASLGAHIVAPCSTAGKCPIMENDWCHFTARVARSRLHKRLKGGDVPYEDEKFCFIAAAREPIRPCSARVLRHPIIESGKIGLRLCTADGVKDITVTRKSPLFKAARKSAAGDIIPLSSE